MVIPPSRPSVGGAFVPMPVGANEGDIAYWDPNAGDSGAWEIIEAPDASEDPNFLTSSGSAPSWSNPLQDILNRIEALEDDMETVKADITDIKADITDIKADITQAQSDISNIISRLDSASISAECNDGNVVVTLNL